MNFIKLHKFNSLTRENSPVTNNKNLTFLKDNRDLSYDKKPSK